MNVSELMPASFQLQLSLPLLLQGMSEPWCISSNDEEGIDLNEYLVRNPEKTFLTRIEGDDLRGEGLFDGDLLVVDRGVKPHHGDIVLASLDDILMCRKLDLKNNCLICGGESDENKSKAAGSSEENGSSTIHFQDHANLVIEGRVRHVIHTR